MGGGEIGLDSAAVNPPALLHPRPRRAPPSTQPRPPRRALGRPGLPGDRERIGVSPMAPGLRDRFARRRRRGAARALQFDVGHGILDGVVRAPSLFSIIFASPPSTTAMAELVVPKSIPNIFDIFTGRR